MNEETRRKYKQHPLIQNHTGTWSGVKTNNTGRGRQGDTRLKNTRESNEEELKQVGSN